jgi:hypothetical protein
MGTLDTSLRVHNLTVFEAGPSLRFGMTTKTEADAKPWRKAKTAYYANN